MKHIDVPPVWLLATLVIAWLIADASEDLRLGAWAGLAGWILLVAGVAMVLAATLEFRKARTTIVPHEAPSALITSGVYRYTRNPIYLGDALILVGLILIWDAPLALLTVPVFAFVIQRRFILPEERRLRDGFPSAWEAWSAATRRWI